MTRLIIDGLPAEWTFPTTRYRGSKRKILSWIWNNTKDLPFNTVLDLFGGTSVVSLLFKRMGKQVTYNDYSLYDHTTGIAFVEAKDGLKLPIGRRGTGVQQILTVLAYINRANSPFVGIEELEMNLSPHSESCFQ